jgi:transposase
LAQFTKSKIYIASIKENAQDAKIVFDKLEGMNNKIKVIKRIAIGCHDDDYFILKIKQGCSPPYDTS